MGLVGWVFTRTFAEGGELVRASTHPTLATLADFNPVADGSSERFDALKRPFLNGHPEWSGAYAARMVRFRSSCREEHGSPLGDPVLACRRRSPQRRALIILAAVSIHPRQQEIVRLKNRRAYLDGGMPQ